MENHNAEDRKHEPGGVFREDSEEQGKSRKNNICLSYLHGVDEHEYVGTSTSIRGTWVRRKGIPRRSKPPKKPV
jgi:hypothetical protein